MKEMKNFISSLIRLSPLRVLDVGSRRANRGPTYRSIIPSNWEYTGLDIVDGVNVDLVAGEPYRWGIPDNEFDAVISGQTLEHVEFPLSWITEIHRVVKPNGRVCIIAPSAGYIHCRPDYRRILPDGMNSLLVAAGFRDINIKLCDIKPWRDCVGTATK